MSQEGLAHKSGLALSQIAHIETARLNTMIVFIAVFFALLFNTPAAVLIIANSGLSYALFHTRYFSYEAITR